jgi:hypothetical protein
VRVAGGVDTLTHEVENDSECKSLRQAQEKVPRLQREVNPTAFEADATVARTVEQIFTEQFAEIIQDSGITRRVEAVTAIVDPNAVQLETAGVAAHRISLL